MSINAGTLTESISIQREVLEPNGSGGFQGGWIPLKETRAAVRRIRGTRDLTAAQIVHNEPYEITTRWRIDVSITAKLKVVHRGRDIILHSVLDEDFQHRVFRYFGYADSKEGGVFNGPDIQLYEDGQPQYYEDGSIQYYEA